MIDNQIICLQSPGCRRSGHSSSNMRRQIKRTAARRLILRGQSGNVDIFPGHIEIQRITNRAFQSYRSRIGRNIPVRQIDGSLIEAVVSTDILIQVAGIGTAGQAE